MNKSIRITAIIIRVTGAVGLDGFLIGFVFYTNSVWDGSVCDQRNVRGLSCFKSKLILIFPLGVLTISTYLKIEVKEPSLSSSASLVSLFSSTQGFPLTVQAQIDFELQRHRLLSNALSLQNRTQSEPGLLLLEQSQSRFPNKSSQWASGFVKTNVLLFFSMGKNEVFQIPSPCPCFFF